MISKKTFVKIMEKIQKEMTFQEKLNSLLDDYCDDSVFLKYDLISSVVELLTELFKDENKWIEWAAFETNMLKDYEPEMATYDDGSVIDLSTWEKVYDFVVENMKEREDA